MAEKTKDVQNLWLLVIAIVLGLLAVVIYNMHISAIRNENQSQMVKVITLTQDVRKDQVLKASFLAEVEIFRDEGKAWKKHALATRLPAIIKGRKKIYASIKAGEFLMERHLTRPEGADANKVIGPGMVGKSISVSQVSSTDLLRADGHIDLLGIFQTKDGRFETVRIIEGLRVVGVGGTRPDMGTVQSVRAPRPMANFRKITIEVDRQTSDRLANLETHCVGEFMIDIVPDPMPRHTPKINTKLDLLSRTAKPKSH